MDEGQVARRPGPRRRGQLYDSGSHLLDALLWITRTRPRSVAAVVDRRGNDVDVNSALAVDLARGGRPVTASVGVSGDGQSVPVPGEAIHLWGTEAAASFDRETVSVEADGETRTTTPQAPSFEELTEAKLANFLAVAAARRPSGADRPTPSG